MVFFVERVKRVLSRNVADPKGGEEEWEELHDPDFGNGSCAGQTNEQ